MKIFRRAKYENWCKKHGITPSAWAQKFDGREVRDGRIVGQRGYGNVEKWCDATR
jgi:hypothetical protein